MYWGRIFQNTGRAGYPYCTYFARGSKYVMWKVFCNLPQTVCPLSNLLAPLSWKSNHF